MTLCFIGLSANNERKALALQPGGRGSWPVCPRGSQGATNTAAVATEHSGSSSTETGVELGDESNHHDVQPVEQER